jgi:hypothetical protein
MATAIWRHKQQYGRRMSSRISLWQRQYGGKKKYNTYCLDVVTSISVMIRMIKTTLFFPEIRAVCETLWENMAEPDRPQMTIKHGACVMLAG